jgi:S-adenosylmethionine:tRNA ribosyltransferase-isomerase
MIHFATISAKPLPDTRIEALKTYPGLQSLDFHLPPELEAGAPPEARGLRRDQVRLMVSWASDDRIMHTCFHQLPEFLNPGDLLVINTSGTMNAALEASSEDGQDFELHLSTHLPGGVWSAELRRPSPRGSQPWPAARAGEVFSLPAGGQARLLAPYGARDGMALAGGDKGVRLWIAALDLPLPINEYLACYGFPIRYGYVPEAWPNSYYQTVYTTEVGSAEMPSAGRAFTEELITRLVAKGVQIAPLLLHTGVASLESHEPPYEEYYRVPVETARAVNTTHAAGKRVIAVGTTVVRALETITSRERITYPGEGWTSTVITPERGLYAVDGLLTGLHEPKSSHLAMLQALAGVDHLRETYRQAIEHGYLWHEFGDLHLILRSRDASLRSA